MKSKKISYFSTLLLAALVLTFSACKKKDDASPQGNSVSEAFNIWTGIGAYPNNAIFIANLASVATGTLDLQGKGVEAKPKFKDQGLIVKNGYYYGISADGRFGKYRITSDQLISEQEIPLTNFSLSYSICPGWIDDHTLFIAASNATNAGAVYAVVNVNTMEVLSSGNIEGIVFPSGYPKLYTGTPAYVNGKIYLGLNFVTSAWAAYPKMCLGVINTTDYSVDEIIEDSRTGSIGNNWGGELYGRCGFTDENGDYYFNTRITVAGQHSSMILRINGSTGVIDPTYIGYNDAANDIREFNYLGNGKALVEIYHPDLYDNAAGKTDAMTFAVIDLASGVKTDLDDAPRGKVGSIKNISTDPIHGKGYLLIHEKTGDSHVWTYDRSTGNLTAGITLPTGYDEFLRVDYMNEF